jgi:hypothetical protein
MLWDVEGHFHALVSPPNTIVANSFQHVALTYDQTTGTGALYLNGQVVAQSQWRKFPPKTSGDIWISYRPFDRPNRFSYNTYYAGLLDEIAIYNRALRANEIQAYVAANGQTDNEPGILGVTILSARFGLGEHIASVTKRVTELLRSQPRGFTVNAESLGVDPKPGKGKRLNIQYDYHGQTHTVSIPGGNLLNYQTLLENSVAPTPVPVSAVASKFVEANAIESLLNPDQRTVFNYLNLKFKKFFDDRTFDGLSAYDRAALETRMLDTLNGPRSDEYYQAINTLAALHSTKALPELRKLAFQHLNTLAHLERSNRPRWMAVRAMGIIGDEQSVPEIIHLLYHNNSYVRWSAQLALVRLTGQNFGSDWQAWGRWWNEQHGNPPFTPAAVRWWRGQAEPDELAKQLAEADQRFLHVIQGRTDAENPASKLVKQLSQ